MIAEVACTDSPVNRATSTWTRDRSAHERKQQPLVVETHAGLIGAAGVRPGGLSNRRGDRHVGALKRTNGLTPPGRHAPPSSSASILYTRFAHHWAEQDACQELFNRMELSLTLGQKFAYANTTARKPLRRGKTASRPAVAGAAIDVAVSTLSGGTLVSKISGLFVSVAAAALSLTLAGGPAHAGDIVGLITKTNTNPFFVKMKQGFEAKAKELGLTPQAYAGKFDGDNDGEVRAIEQLIAAGAKGILLVPSDSTAIVRRSRRRATPGPGHHARHPARPNDARRTRTSRPTISRLASSSANGRRAPSATRPGRQDRHPRSRAQSADRRYLRHNGFLTGFGIKVKDPKHYSQAIAHRSSAPT